MQPQITTLSIDRKTPFQFPQIGMTDSGEYRLKHVDPKAVALHEIDLSRVIVKELIDTDSQSVSEINARIEKTCEELSSEGYVFLDAKVLEEMYTHQHIPGKILHYSFVEFRATVFEKDGIDYYVCVSPDGRGGWVCEMRRAEFEEHDLQTYREYGRVTRYAVVLLPDVK